MAPVRTFRRGKLKKSFRQFHFPGRFWYSYSTMLSIVIPTLNEADFLPLLLQSIRAQNYPDYEIIVSDNGSKDGTVEIARRFGATVVPGGLPSAGRNRGASAAKGDVILFLDSDVVLPDPDFLVKTVDEFRVRRLGFATCPILPLSDRFVDRAFHTIFNFYMWLTQMAFPHAPGFCIFARRDLHDRIGGFDEDVRFAEDHDYVGRAARVGKFRLLRSRKIPVSVRRLDKEGRLGIARKYLQAEFYLRTHGSIKTDIFEYKFGEFSQECGGAKDRNVIRERS